MIRLPLVSVSARRYRSELSGRIESPLEISQAEARLDAHAGGRSQGMSPGWLAQRARHGGT